MPDADHVLEQEEHPGYVKDRDGSLLTCNNERPAGAIGSRRFLGAVN
jgi:hypothetical protein